ncbi:uncharacterized protein [Cherax quadricarinatus]|uniref:uncharacterized protein isoform X2 n=1 Tax=Cherax quadricarinatus TaxID=27406 RepID=UPI00387EC60C
MSTGLSTVFVLVLSLCSTWAREILPQPTYLPPRTGLPIDGRGVNIPRTQVHQSNRNDLNSINRFTPISASGNFLHGGISNDELIAPGIQLGINDHSSSRPELTSNRFGQIGLGATSSFATSTGNVSPSGGIAVNIGDAQIGESSSRVGGPINDLGSLNLQVGAGRGSAFTSGDSSSRVVSGPGAGVTFGQINVPRASVAGQINRVNFLITPTVTQIVTIDRFVTLTDLAFNSVAVTLTSFNVQTVTAGTRVVVATPVDERVALQTTVVLRPTSVTMTEVKSDFRVVTEVSVDHVTITHTSYIISQYTYTTTATQVLTYTSTLVRTNLRTASTTFTEYRTVADTVYVGGNYGTRF